eukprot:g4634.t1
MDYSHDSCYYAFTLMQNEVMKSAYSTATWIQSASGVPSRSVAPSASSTPRSVSATRTPVSASPTRSPVSATPTRSSSPSPGSISPSPSPCTDSTFILTIMLDNYPAETTFTLTQGNQVLLSDGPFPGQGGTVQTYRQCLSNGNYLLAMKDTYGDGICCAYGQGSFVVSLDDVVIAQGGQFTFQVDIPFTVGVPSPSPSVSVTPSPSPCVDSIMVFTLTLDRYPSETSFALTEGNQVLLSDGSFAAGQEGSVHTYRKCLGDGDYLLAVQDSYGDGICCGYGQGSYELMLDGVMIASGGEFTYKVDIPFTVRSPTPSSSPSVSLSLSPSTSASVSRTASLSLSPSVSRSSSISTTPTRSASASLSPTPSTSRTASVSLSRSRTPSISITPSRSPTISITPSRSPTISITRSRSPTRSRTPSRSPVVGRR